jgi:hypothetical protein
MAEEEESPGRREAKSEEPPASASPIDSAKQVAEVIQNFGMVLAPSSSFGGIGAQSTVSRDWLIKASGKLTPAEIEMALRHFVPPLAFEEARTALYQDHVVLLGAPRGSGKLTGAIALLSERAERLLVLPPASLRVLSEREYDKNTGYVLSGKPDEKDTTETAFIWRELRDRVRDAKAYLVITSTAPARTASDAVRQVSWSPPSTREVLAEYLPGRDDVIDQIATEASVGEHTMTELVSLASRVATGESLDDVLRESERVLSARVRAWFQDHRSKRAEVLAITALAFLSGVAERTFEVQLALLEGLVAEAFPLPEASDVATTSDALPQRGMDRLDETLVARRVVHGIGASRTLAFKHPGYQRHVLAELSRTCPAQFWDAVRAWLNQIVLDGEGALVASGLAQLARVDFVEVRDLYLEPWSKGAHGALGQITATYVLWKMCYDETTLPLALPTANRWASHGNPGQRWTAAVALCGELGILYPAEAVRRLWELVKQSAAVGGDACLAFAGLFASLVDAGKNASAGQVLSTMDWQRRVLLRRSRPDQNDRTHLRDRTISAIIEVLGIREVKRTRPAILRLLRAQPEQAFNIGELWAYALRHRVARPDTQVTFRKEALNALRVALHALREESSSTESSSTEKGAGAAEEDARTLCEAIASALPDFEIQPLIRDLNILEARSRHQPDEAFSSILLAALDRHLHRPPAKE